MLSAIDGLRRIILRTRKGRRGRRSNRKEQQARGKKTSKLISQKTATKEIAKAHDDPIPVEVVCQI